MAISKYGHERGNETRTVRRALRLAGIPAVVSHGRGTAWGWIHVNIGNEWGEHERHDDQQPGCFYSCVACARRKEAEALAREIVLRVTGRTGGYHGCGDLLIQTQRAWCQRCRESYEPRTGHKHQTKGGPA